MPLLAVCPPPLADIASASGPCAVLCGSGCQAGGMASASGPRAVVCGAGCQAGGNRHSFSIGALRPALRLWLSIRRHGFSIGASRRGLRGWLSGRRQQAKLQHRGLAPCSAAPAVRPAAAGQASAPGPRALLCGSGCPAGGMGAGHAADARSPPLKSLKKGLSLAPFLPIKS